MHFCTVKENIYLEEEKSLTTVRNNIKAYSLKAFLLLRNFQIMFRHFEKLCKLNNPVVLTVI